MRVLASLAAAAALGVLVVPAGSAATSPGSGSPGCLRGQWKANQAETQRVMRALVPTGGFEVNGRLYMIFRDGAFQYGSTGLVVRNTVGDATMSASGRFFTLARYSARTGQLVLRAGRSTMEWGQFTATKAGQTFSVPGPAPSTRATPGGAVPFRCHGNTLKVRLPAFASLDWITLRRG